MVPSRPGSRTLGKDLWVAGPVKEPLLMVMDRVHRRAYVTNKSNPAANVTRNTTREHVEANMARYGFNIMDFGLEGFTEKDGAIVGDIKGRGRQVDVKINGRTPQAISRAQVCVCMCVWMCMCVYVCMYGCENFRQAITHARVCVCMCVCVHVWKYLCMCSVVCVSVCTCVYIHMYVCMYV